MALPTLMADIIDGIITRKNYITGQVEKSTAGWATYADAAAASPVDGTGGSPNVTFGTTATNPIMDAQSFQLVKDAANRQGQGFSRDFTINRGHRFSVMRIGFKYEVASGTFSYGDGTVATPSDLRVFIYDVTNGVLIEPNNSLLDGSGEFISEFQTTDSTSYRLIIHCATVSASAYTVNFDRFEVAQRDLARGPFMSDWTPFTPSDTSISGFPTGARDFQYMRIGGTISVRFKLTASGAITGTDLIMAEWLPPGLAADLTKIGSSTGGVWGVATAVDASAASNVDDFSCTAIILSNGNLRVNVDRGDTVDATDPFTWAVSDTLDVTVWNVPIAGWQSNTVLSSDVGTRNIAFSGTKGSTQAVTANVTDVTFTASRDSHSAWSGSVYTIKESGDYCIMGNVWDNASGTVQLRVFKNGSNTGYFVSESLTGNPIHPGSVVLSLVAGDTISLRSSATLTLSANGSIGIFKIQSSQTLGMADRVSCRYTTAAGQSFTTGTTTIVDYGTKDYDTTNSVTTGGSWKWTAPRAGIADITAKVLWQQQSFTAGNSLEINIFKNGTAISQAFSTIDATAVINRSMLISDSISVVAGDTIDIRVFQNSGGSRNINANGPRNTLAINLR